MNRAGFLKKISTAFKNHPIVALLGPRQCGKTTLAKMYIKNLTKVTFFDLEDTRDLASLENPLLALEDLNGYIVIDEIQRKPNLFPILRVLADKYKNQKYLILGSASRELIKQSSETLAGRIAYLELTPFSLAETQDLSKLWLLGGFPKSYLADNIAMSIEWRKHYITTFLEQDIPNLGMRVAPPTLRRFWMMLAHYHGNIFNASEIGRSLGFSHTTIKNYLDILSNTFMLRQLTPWYENIKKRQVKAPKVYFRDSGILHSFLEINSMSNLKTNPKLGASWEGIALENIIQIESAAQENTYFWSTHGNAELDLLIIKGQKRLGFEFKYQDAPKLTPSMRTALEYLKLDSLTVIVPGKANSIKLASKVNIIALENYRSSY
jgi:predicted AAA+ superfamily ATPase